MIIKTLFNTHSGRKAFSRTRDFGGCHSSWWSVCAQACRTDKNSNKYLIFQLTDTTPRVMTFFTEVFTALGFKPIFEQDTKIKDTYLLFVPCTTITNTVKIKTLYFTLRSARSGNSSWLKRYTELRELGLDVYKSFALMHIKEEGNIRYSYYGASPIAPYGLSRSTALGPFTKKGWDYLFERGVKLSYDTARRRASRDIPLSAYPMENLVKWAKEIKDDNSLSDIFTGSCVRSSRTLTKGKVYRLISPRGHMTHAVCNDGALRPVLLNRFKNVTIIAESER